MRNNSDSAAYEAAILANSLTLPAIPGGVSEDLKVPIRVVGDWTQTIDLYARPGIDRPRPAIVCLHGGGWSVGQAADYRQFARLLAWRYDAVVASVSYRLIDRARFPTQIQDAANGIRWLRAHAARLGIDTTRVGLLGASAGGYLTAMVALTHDRQDLAGGDAINGESAAVQAIVAQWGPLDFIARWYGNGGSPGAEAGLLGTVYTEDPALYHYASALTYVHASYGHMKVPPALFIYGNHDRVVHPQQGELALAAWKRAGAPADLLRLDWIGHVQERPEDIEASRQATMEFMALRLDLKRRSSFP